MDEIIYNALGSYYHALEVKGYMPYKDMSKLLILIFIRDFVFHDYHGIISKEDYYTIEKALDCLYGSTCLIPYPDYLKMGKLYLGSLTEMADRLKNVENTEVLKLIHDTAAQGDSDSDVQITLDEED